ncbi:MFS transporter [Salinibacterium hongtaonis]|uniref:MFS transporter n=1 Tax=Homoserinimonas hongtaonis TaxID=2079791 RepID=A0A2U1T0I3_9MICO|nr:MFS transporter [Salinibacterium hongtaonis]PWB97367.1 MFS transporter [Salinibacterium hongtaonis]
MSTSRIGIYSAPYLWTTIGACALVFLNAFENLAVTTIMPIVSDDLDGARLYALAFAAPLAVGVIGMVVAGNWSDRAGPTGPLYLSGALFVAGLLVAGTAQEMWVLVVGRLVQGLGGGGVTVALYVLVARIYPPDLHHKIFAAFAAAWVVPSMIGPAIAGVIAQLFSWHWVFLGVVGLVLAAVGMVVPAVRVLASQPVPENPQPWAWGRIGWSILAAGAVLALNLSEQAPDALAPVIAVGALVLLVVAVRPLVPKGTLLARRGLASVVLSRSLVAAAFFGAEVYIPYLLIDEYAFDPSLAGVALTGAAVSWATGSWLQGKLGARLRDVMAMRIGALMVLAAVVIAFATAALHLAPWIIIAGWVIGGGGMGLMYPRMSSMTLARSTPASQGFNSSAITIADSLGAALALATTGLIVAALVDVDGAASFAGVFALTIVIAAVALAISGRVEEPSVSS